VTATATGYNTTYKDSSQVYVSYGDITLGTPSISGTLKVGYTLTSSIPSVSPSATLTYQWYRGSTAISGANSRTYTTVAADSGQYLKVRVTATLTGYNTTYKESSQVYIAVASPAAISSVTVTGVTAQGYQLTATASGVTPSNASLTYQWYRNSVAISGATSRYYTLVAADAAQYLHVKATASLAGYLPATVSSSGFYVTGTGTGVVGTLSATDGGSVAGWFIRYDNYSCDGLEDIKTPSDDFNWAPVQSNGQFAGGRYTGNCYRLYVANAQYQLVPSTYNGVTTSYHYVASGSRGVQLKVPTKLVIGSVAISGTPAVSYQLTATASGVGPANASLSYQWYRGSTAISGATKATYTLAAADAGLAIMVRVTARSSGFSDVTKDSSVYYPVASGAGVAGTVVSSSGTTPTSFTVRYDNYTCDGKTDIRTPTDDYSSASMTSNGAFAGGKLSTDCYKITVVKGSTEQNITYNGTTAKVHYVPAGSRGVTLRVP
jgi:hypothetical protein